MCDGLTYAQSSYCCARLDRACPRTRSLGFTLVGRNFGELGKRNGSVALHGVRKRWRERLDRGKGCVGVGEVGVGAIFYRLQRIILQWKPNNGYPSAHVWARCTATSRHF